MLIENLNMNGMSQVLNFGKSVADNALGDVHNIPAIQVGRARQETDQNWQIEITSLFNKEKY